MARTLVFPTKYASISVGDMDYRPDAKGMIRVENEDHVPDLLRFGAHDPSSVIAYADRPREDTPEPAPAPQAIDVAPKTEEAPETPSETAGEATGAPDKDATKTDLIEWLVQRGVDVPSRMSKAEAWAMVESMVEKAPAESE